MRNMNISQKESKLVTGLLQQLSAQSVDIWNEAVPQTVPASEVDIQQLEKAIALGNVTTNVQTLTRVADKVKKHKSCEVYMSSTQQGVNGLGALHRFPEDLTVYADPFTNKHLNSLHETLRQTGICGQSGHTEKGIFGDCFASKFAFMGDPLDRKVHPKIPISVSGLKNKQELNLYPEIKKEVKDLEHQNRYSTTYLSNKGKHINGYRRFIYTRLPGESIPRWINVFEIPLVFSNGNEIRQIFGQLPSGFLNAKSGSTVYGKPEYPQEGVGWFRRGEHEFKSITQNIPEPLAKIFFPEKPDGTDYNAAKIIRHIHWEQLQKSDDGEYFICSHSLYYPAEFWNPYPKPGY